MNERRERILIREDLVVQVLNPNKKLCGSSLKICTWYIIKILVRESAIIVMTSQGVLPGRGGGGEGEGEVPGQVDAVGVVVDSRLVTAV